MFCRALARRRGPTSGRRSARRNGLSRLSLALAAAALLLVLPGRASAADRFCDPAFEDCRAPLLALIDNEQVGIDVAFWFMEDARYSAALERAKARNVTIRVIFDSEALPNEPVRQEIVDTLMKAHIPMREKVDPGINHWKLMIFAGQKVVQFSGANHTPEAFVYDTPYSAYVDEVIYFTDRPSLVDSFMTKFDDVWTSNTGMMANYGPDVTTLERHYPVSPIDPELNFPPFESFRDRSTSTYRAENTRIDAIIYRITDRAHTDTLIENVQRGVGMRLITEPFQYRDESRLWHSWNVDRLYKAGLDNPIAGQPGIQIRHREHVGLNHEKLSIMIGQGISVIGSSNWTSASSEYQLEHNLFTRDPAFYQWSRNHFERKWNNLGSAPETTAFVPLPPDRPVPYEPANGAAGQGATVTLQWHAGPWAHKYDVFLGTNPNSLAKIVNDQELGPYDISTTISGLVPGTQYYWRVVSRTMADLTQTSDTFSFVTAGISPTNLPPAVSLSSPAGGATFTAPASIAMTATASDPDGTVARVDFFVGTTLLGSATSAPFTFTWSNAPAGNYNLTAQAVDNLGAVTTSTPPVAISVSPGSGANLPAPWLHSDIGSVTQGGGASVSGGTWSVTGSGVDVWGNADQFHYAYQQLTGDGTITARIATIQNVDVWTKAGVMLRESLAPGSAQAFMLATPAGSTKGLAFQRRTATDGVSTHTAGGDGGPPVWVRLTRSGNTISSYRSADGVNWTLVGSDVLPMAATISAGLAVVSHNAGALATATFDNVTVVPAGTPPPPINAPPSVSLTAPAAESTFTAPAAITVSATATDTDGTVTKVDFYAGATLIETDTASPYSLSWNNVPQGDYAITARATDNLGAESVSAPALTVHVTGGTSQGLPAGWLNQDVGSVTPDGSTSFNNGVFTVRGSGADIWDTVDGFHFAYRMLTGDGTIVARVATLQNVDPWTKAGVMLRASLTPGSAHALMFVTPGSPNGLAFQRRTATNVMSSHTSGGDGAAPVWVRLTRSGNTISAFRSADGNNWTLVDTDVIPMGATIYAGLAVTSHSNGILATAMLDNVSVTPASQGLPTGWSSQDIGAVTLAGSTAVSNGVFTVRGAGADIWGTADEFQFAYRTLTGNGAIVARVATLQNADQWTKAGVMIRASLTPGSRHAMMIASSAKGLAFQRRTSDNAASVHTAGPLLAAPTWVRLERTGDTITASFSNDGVGWTLVGTETIALPATVFIGLPVTSHNAGTTATATIDNVTVTP